MGKMMALLPRTIGLRPQKLKDKKKKSKDKTLKKDKKKNKNKEYISLDSPRSNKIGDSDKISNSNSL